MSSGGIQQISTDRYLQTLYVTSLTTVTCEEIRPIADVLRNFFNNSQLDGNSHDENGGRSWRNWCCPIIPGRRKAQPLTQSPRLRLSGKATIQSILSLSLLPNLSSCRGDRHTQAHLLSDQDRSSVPDQVEQESPVRTSTSACRWHPTSR